MKLRWAVILLLTFLAIGAFGIYFTQKSIKEFNNALNQNPPLLNAVGKNVTWLTNSNQSITVATFKNLPQASYIGENALSIKSTAIINNWSAAINGMYFIGSFVDATPAGLLQINGTQIVKNTSISNQVTTIVIMNYSTGQLKFESVKNFKAANLAANLSITMFQTGPMLIKNTELQTTEISESANGAELTLRSAMGQLQNGDYFFVASEVILNLTDFTGVVSELLSQNSPILNMVNLDGGSSTGIYSQEFDEFSFKENTRIPMVLGVEQ